MTAEPDPDGSRTQNTFAVGGTVIGIGNYAAAGPAVALPAHERRSEPARLGWMRDKRAPYGHHATHRTPNAGG